MTNDGPIRVLLADDQDLLRVGFSLILSAEPSIEMVGEAGDGQQALERLESLDGQCDVVLMDVRMPRMNGIDATRAVTERFPETRVLVLTTFDLDEYAQAAVRAGASGFLLKDARPTELIDAIQRVAAGDAVMAPALTRRMLEQMVATDAAAGGAAASRAGDSAVGDEDSAVLDVLTEREREVLALIGAGLNNAEISDRLFLSESTVKTHVGRVLFKLDLRDRIQAVILAHRLGL